MKILIDGIVCKLRSGLNRRNVLSPEMLSSEGIAVNSDVTTTRKSSQFHASSR